MASNSAVAESNTDGSSGRSVKDYGSSRIDPLSESTSRVVVSRLLVSSGGKDVLYVRIMFCSGIVIDFRFSTAFTSVRR